MDWLLRREVGCDYVIYFPNLILMIFRHPLMQVMKWWTGNSFWMTSLSDLFENHILITDVLINNVIFEIMWLCSSHQIRFTDTSATGGSFSIILATGSPFWLCDKLPRQDRWWGLVRDSTTWSLHPSPTFTFGSAPSTVQFIVPELVSSSWKQWNRFRKFTDPIA